MTTHELARQLLAMPNVPVVAQPPLFSEIVDAKLDTETFWDKHGDKVHEVCAVLE